MPTRKMEAESLWQPFIIPKEFLTTPISPSSSSTLLTLPPEILIEIFRHADRLDQVCLAFTCKYLLRISSTVSVKTLSPTRHKAACTCRKVEEFLRRVRPIHSHGRRRPKKTWALCIDCVRYRPTRKSYWKPKQKEWANATVWEMKVHAWNDRRSLQCPECWCEEWRLVLDLQVP